MMLLMLLRGTPVETRDPDTKALYGFALILHVSVQVIATIFELLMAFVAFDVVVDGLVSADMTSYLIEYIIGGVFILLPGTCLLISILIYTGLLVEI